MESGLLYVNVLVKEESSLEQMKSVLLIIYTPRKYRVYTRTDGLHAEKMGGRRSVGLEASVEGVETELFT